MIERIVDWCARNRFLVFAVYGVAAGLAAAAWFLARGR